VSWKFRKRIRACPGVRVNISRSGFSSTIGVPGFSVNFGKRGTYLNLGVPGTGFYDRIRLDGSVSSPKGTPQDMPFSSSASDIKSTGLDVGSDALRGMRTALLDMRKERARTREELEKLDWLIKRLLREQASSRRRATGFLSRFIAETKRQELIALAEIIERDTGILKTEAKSLTDYAASLNLPVFTEWTDDAREAWDALTVAFRKASKCSLIWDITAESSVDRATRARTRSNAQSLIDRHPTKWRTGYVDDLLSTVDALVFGNVNGPDLYLYPSFIYIPAKDTFFDIRDLDADFINCRFTERERLPPDAKTDGNTWAKVNKDGSPDRRFNGNHQIPIAVYGEITVSSTSGIREAYLLSDVNKAKEFFIQLRMYLDICKPQSSRSGASHKSRQRKKAPPPPKPTEDPYAVLGVSQDASMEEITRVYRSLAKIYHGDVSTPGIQSDQMQRINAAYDDIVAQRRR
jgi:hypothetical protein